MHMRLTSMETILLCVHVHINRVDNVKFWLNEFPDWNLEARNNSVGGIALGLALFMGPNRLRIDTIADRSAVQS